MNSHEVFIHIHQGTALGQSLDCHSASEVTLMDMGKSVNVKPQQSTAKQKPCAYFLGYTVHEYVGISQRRIYNSYFKINKFDNLNRIMNITGLSIVAPY